MMLGINPFDQYGVVAGKLIVKKFLINGLDLKQVPNTPKIYKFFSKNKIIYIGKAKDLKKECPHILVNLLK